MDKFFDLASAHLLATLKASAAQLFILLGPGLLLGFILSVISGQLSKTLQRALGLKLYLALSGAVGTSVHELGHAVFHLIFRHKIHEMKLYDPKPNSDGSYTLGYVSYSVDSRSLYQLSGKFFSAVGPLILGAVVMSGAAMLLVPGSFSASFSGLSENFSPPSSAPAARHFISEFLHSIRGALAGASEWDFRSWKPYLFLYILFCVGSHQSLSRKDLEGAFFGLFALFGVLFSFNFVALFFGGVPEHYFVSFSKQYSMFYAVMISAIVMNLAMLAPAKVLLFFRSGKFL